MIHARITGQEQVIARFGEISATVRERMMATLTRFATDLEAHVQVNKLSGQVLNRRTGRLSNSINKKVIAEAQSISAVVGANLGKAKYAAAHEYGTNKPAMVPAHQRMVTMAFGKRITPRVTTVRAHMVRMNLPQRSFLRSSLRDMAPEGIAMIRATLMECIAESKA